MKTSKTKKRFLLSLVAVIACVAMLIGTTFAWFTDSVSNTGNKIQAGTLKVDLLKATDDSLATYESIAGQKASVFTDDVLWEPGQTQYAYLAVENKGNLAMKYNILLDVVDRETNEDLNVPMAGAFTYAIVNQDTPTFIDSWKNIINTEGVQKGNLLDAIQAVAPGEKSARITAAQGGKIETQNDKDYFLIAVHMNEEAGNAYQNGLIEIDVNVVATQLASELDGFDNPNYDANSQFPEVAKRIEGKPSYKATKEVIDALGNTEKVNLTIEADTSLSAAVSGKEAKSQLNQILQNIPEEKRGEATDTTLDLTLNVKTTEVKTEEIALDISMDGTVTTVKKAEGQEDVKTVEKMQIHSTTDMTVVQVKLDKSLKNVAVAHNGTPMQEITLPSDEEGYAYDASTGNVVIQTKSFSPYLITFERENVVKNNTTNKFYASLDEAIKEVKTNETLDLLKNSDALCELSGSKTVTLNLNNSIAKYVNVDNGATLKLTGNGSYWGTISGNLNIAKGNYECLKLGFGNSGKATISGGFVKVLESTDAKGHLNIKGGQFGFDPTAYADTECYEVKKSETEDIWTVTAKPMPFYIGEQGYPTLQAAFNAAKAKTATITQEMDYVLDAYAVLNSDANTKGQVTLDMNGHKITSTARDASGLMRVLNHKTFTLENGSILCDNDGTGTAKVVRFYNVPNVTVKNMTVESYGAGLELDTCKNTINLINNKVHSFVSPVKDNANSTDSALFLKSTYTDAKVKVSGGEYTVTDKATLHVGKYRSGVAAIKLYSSSHIDLLENCTLTDCWGSGNGEDSGIVILDSNSYIGDIVNTTLEFNTNHAACSFRNVFGLSNSTQVKKITSCKFTMGYSVSVGATGGYTFSVQDSIYASIDNAVDAFNTFYANALNAGSSIAKNSGEVKPVYITTSSTEVKNLELPIISIEPTN